MAGIAKLVRRAAELLSRQKVVKRRMTVGGRAVSLFVSPDAQLKYLKFGRGAFDQDLIEIAERLLSPEDVIWDVGANVGTFTFAAATVASRGAVVAIEADPWLSQVIRRSSKLPDYRDRSIRIVACAIADADGIAVFDVAARGRASSTLHKVGGHSQMGGVRESFDVPTLTLDTLSNYLPTPTFIKIDTEGAELLALQGATKLLQTARPLLYVEVGTKTAEPVKEMMESLSYGMYMVDGKSISSCALNTLFVPTERAADVFPKETNPR